MKEGVYFIYLFIYLWMSFYLLNFVKDHMCLSKEGEELQSEKKIDSL